MTVTEIGKVLLFTELGMFSIAIVGLFYTTAQKALSEGNWLIIPLQIFFVVWATGVAIAIVVLS